MFQPIKNILEKCVGKYVFKNEILATNILEIWKKEIDFPGSSPLYFKQGILYIKAQNASVSQEIQFKKNELIQFLNKKLKKNLVKNIIFRF